MEYQKCRHYDEESINYNKDILIHPIGQAVIVKPIHIFIGNIAGVILT